jgi:hypothetical protein
MFENPSPGLSNTAQKDRNNVLRLSLNGSMEITDQIVLSVLPGKNHCLKIGDKMLHLTKVADDIVHLHHNKAEFAFTIKKISYRYFLTKSNSDEAYGLMRFTSTSKHPSIVDNSDECLVLAQNLSSHTDYILLMKERAICSLTYTTEENIVKKINNKESVEVVKEYHSKKVVFSQEGFQII